MAALRPILGQILHPSAGDVIVTSNTTIEGLTAEIQRLHIEVSRLVSLQSFTSPQSIFQGKEITTVGCGSGAGSPEVFQQIIKRNWHGRLGRSHMVDVDRMSDPVKKELDCFLRRKLLAIFPVGGGYSPPNTDGIFATLATFGLRLEDRGQLADVTIVNDGDILNSSTVRRTENFAAFYLRNGTYENYWMGYVLETLLELARYRGLFTEDGFIKVIE